MKANEFYLSVGAAKRLIQLKPVVDSSPGIAAVAAGYQKALDSRENCGRCPGKKQPPAFNLTVKLCEAIVTSGIESKKLIAAFLKSNKVYGHISGNNQPVLLIDLSNEC